MKNLKQISKFLLILLMVSSCGKANNNQENIEVAPQEEIAEIEVENEPIVESLPQFIDGVDLGLPSRTIWATVNLDANEPWETGNYYSLGKLVPGSLTRNEFNEQKALLSKNLPIGGNPKYDAVTAKWGEDWRTPTQSEFYELQKYGDWKWLKDGGVEGFFITGPNGNTIFLPAVGYESSTMGNSNMEHDFKGYGILASYWTYETSDTPKFYDVAYYKTPKQSYTSTGGHSWGYDAYPLRAVSTKSLSELGLDSISKVDSKIPTKPMGYENNYGYVDLGLPSGTKWATHNIGASSPYQLGQSFAWGKINPEEKYDIFNKDEYISPSKKEFEGDKNYDAASVIWGGKWQLPSAQDLNELIQNCDWRVVKGEYKGSKYDYIIARGPNKNTIIIPFLDNVNDPNSIVMYWSSTESPMTPEGSSELDLAYVMWCSRMGSPAIGSNWKYGDGMIRPIIKNNE